MNCIRSFGLFLAFGLVLSSLAQAAEVKTQAQIKYEQEQARLQQEHNAALERLEAQITSSQTTYDSQKAAREQAQREYREARRNKPTWLGDAFNQGSDDRARRAEEMRRYEEARAKLDGVETDLDSAASGLTGAKEAREKAEREAARRDSELGKQIRAERRSVERLEEEVRDANAFQRYSVLRNKLQNDEDTLTVVINTIDDSLMAQYMAEKMAKMINSKSMCDAAKACASGATKANIDKAAIKAEFFGTEGSSGNTAPVTPSAPATSNPGVR